MVDALYYFDEHSKYPDWCFSMGPRQRVRFEQLMWDHSQLSDDQGDESADDEPQRGASDAEEPVVAGGAPS